METKRESPLEKFIVDFVMEKVTERVRLYLTDEITVRPVNLRRSGGSYLLATFWANVLQHELNYPPSKHTYRRHRTTGHDGRRPRELLELAVSDEDVQLFVDMTTGVLTITGKFVYDWFASKFRQMLENVDDRFAHDWSFVPTPTGDLPLTGDEDDRTRQQHEKTDTEAYLLLEGRGCQRVDHRLQEQLDNTCNDLSDTYEVPWSSEEVEKQLTEVLGNGGGLFDGSLYIHPLWLSLLRHWFSRADGSAVYIATPLLDPIRLADIAEACTKFVDVQLAALYVNFDDCDPDCRRSTDAGYVQQRVLQRYDSSTVRAAIEYRLLRHVVYPLRQRLAGTGAFLARAPPAAATEDSDREVEVILSGASFHARDLCHSKVSSVVLVRMTFDAFRARYLEPLEAKAVTSTKLY